MAKKSDVLAKAKAAAAAVAAPGAGTSTPSKSTPAAAAVLSPAAAAHTVAAVPTAPTTRLRRKVNRREFNFAVFVGSSIAPKAWCKTREEVSAFIQTVPSKKLDAIDVATLTPVKTAVTVNF